jgi:5-methylcytosine-specific restriction endonuclease McrA
MTTRSRYSNEEIINAYQQTGSIWAAGKRLGLAGQSVHERLVAVGYPLAARRWTPAEIEELKSLLGHVSLAEVAHRLGRPYAGVAIKASRLGVSGRQKHQKKIPRGAGYDKASIARYIKQIDASDDKVSRFARRHGLGVEMLCRSIEKHFPEWWLQYKRTHSDLAERPCPYCGSSFIPSNARQTYCSRKCATARRVDEDYFGGNRRHTVGLAEGQCQLCSRTEVKALSSHHVLGKENDPDNQFLIALCSGCHKVVTLLASRTFVDDAGAWEALIELAWLRKHGSDPQPFGVEVYVEVERLTPRELAEMDEEEAS